MALTLTLLPPLLPPLPHITSFTIITPATDTAAPRYPCRPRLGSLASLPTTRASFLHRRTKTHRPNPPHQCQLNQSCPTVSTTTARPVPPTCIAMGGARDQFQALPSRSSPHPPPCPPPPAPPVPGPVLPQPCCQTISTTARWVPRWYLHQKSPAGRTGQSQGLTTSLWSTR